MKYLIIEDEPLAQRELKCMMDEIDSKNELLGSIPTVGKAIQWFADNPMPELIFMDIHLADDICFRIFDAVEITAPVIFTTAYDKYAVDAFKTCGIGYLLKPYSIDDLKQVLNKYKKLREKENGVSDNIKEMLQEILKNPTAAPQYKERILAKVGDNYLHIRTSEIAYLFTEDHYTFAVNRENKQLIINHTINSIEQQLDPKRFFRISRSFILNIDAIANVSRHLNGRLKLSVTPSFSEELYVARNRVNDFLEWLDGSISTIQ